MTTFHRMRLGLASVPTLHHTNLCYCMTPLLLSLNSSSPPLLPPPHCLHQGRMAAALAPPPGPGHPHPAPSSLSLPSPLPPTTQGGLYGSCQKREALIRRFSSQRDEAPSRTGCHTYKHTLRVIQDFRTQVKQSRNCTVPSQGLKCFSGLRRSKRTGGCPGLLSRPQRSVFSPGAQPVL